MSEVKQTPHRDPKSRVAKTTKPRKAAANTAVSEDSVMESKEITVSANAQPDHSVTSRNSPPVNSGASRGPAVGADPFPVLRRHKNKLFPPLTYYIPRSRSYTQEKIDRLKKYHPSAELSKLHCYTDDNEHPECAAYRSISEAYMLNRLVQEIPEEKELIESTMIMDVGGAARRHHANGRKFVWSCIPEFDARDAIRSFKLPGKLHCKHRWQDCTCVKVSASISVHSLYYIEPADILVQILKQSVPVHYAALHMYPEDKGTLMNGEMEYRKKDGKVFARAVGNLTWYAHSDMSWLETGHYSDPNGTLEWDILRRFSDVTIMRFVAVARQIPAPPLPPCCNVSVPVQPKTLACDVEKFAEIVNDSINYAVPISAPSYKKFIDKVTRKGRENKLDIEKLVLFATDKYHHQRVITPPATFKLYEKSREQYYRLNLVYDTTDYLKMVTVFFAFIAFLYLTIRQEYVVLDIASLVRLFWARPRMLEFSTFLVGLCALAWNHERLFKMLNFSNRNLLPTTHPTSIFRAVKARVDDYCCALPDRELDTTKCSSIKLPPDFGLECEAKPAAHAMVYHPDYAPYYPRKCLHNTYSCIRNKLLHLLPVSGTYTLKLHPILVEAAAKIRGNFEPLDFEEWVSRFPNQKETRLRNEYEENEQDVVNVWNNSKVFVKHEGYPEPKYPRPIISSDVEFNFSTGRWLIPIGELLAESLPSHIMFPLHGDSIKIGSFHDQYRSYKMVDNDYTSFDSSQREPVLVLISEFLLLCGVPQVVVDRELQDIKFIKVRTRHGMKIIMKGIRCSGRSATLIGNSLVTMNTCLWIYGDNMVALLVKGDDGVIYLREMVDVDTYVKKFSDQGLIVKMREVDNYEVEFCTSIFLPCAEGSVLVGKPGKLIAKTFWCKDLHKSKEDMMDQFAGILKGLSRAIGVTPGIRGLLNNGVYVSRFNKVEAIYSEFNEYAHEWLTPDYESVEFICNRYDLEPSDLEELEVELSKGFPVRLQSLASRVMIEKDWGPPNDGSHLTEFYVMPELVDVFVPMLEEVFRFWFPLETTLFLGLVESFCYLNLLNFIMHFVYMVISVNIHPLVALLVHFGYNALAGPRTNVFTATMTLNKRVPVKKTGQKKRKNKKGRKSKGLNMTPYARIIADPCNGIIPEGFYGTASGILSRYKTEAFTTSTNTNGYLLWCPSYPGTSGVNGGSFNCVWYSPALPTTQILNSTADPLGTAIASSGLSLLVGASPFVYSSTCQEFRTLSACMRLNYTGPMQSTQGRVAIIQNYPLRSLLNNRPTVENLFGLASDTMRTPLEPLEIKFRPNNESEKWKDDSAKAYIYGTAGAVASSISEPAIADQPVCFGIAWRGLGSDQIAAEFIQNIEWKPQSGSGYVEPDEKVISDVPMYKKALNFLDESLPGWSATLSEGLGNLASSTIRGVLGGPSNASRTPPGNMRQIQYK